MIFSLSLTVFNSLHPSKILLPISVTLDGNTIEVNLEPANALSLKTEILVKYSN